MHNTDSLRSNFTTWLSQRPCFHKAENWIWMFDYIVHYFVQT